MMYGGSFESSSSQNWKIVGKEFKVNNLGKSLEINDFK